MATRTINIVSYKKANIYGQTDMVISIKYEDVIDGVATQKECFIYNIPTDFTHTNDITKQELELFVSQFTENTEKINTLIRDLYFNKISFTEVLAADIND
jgi:hypothetical protein